jgi:hypothetical protein
MRRDCRLGINAPERLEHCPDDVRMQTGDLEVGGPEAPRILVVNADDDLAVLLELIDEVLRAGSPAGAGEGAGRGGAEQELPPVKVDDLHE